MIATARLVDGHLADLQGSGLSVETVMASGIYSASAAEVSGLLGYGTGPGMAIPYPQNGHGGAPFIRVKLDHAGPDGKRYRTRKDSGNRLYIPPLIDPERLADVTVPVYVCDGEKKCLRANQEGLLCLGLAGVWSWRTTGPTGRTAHLPELDEIP